MWCTTIFEDQVGDWERAVFLGQQQVKPCADWMLQSHCGCALPPPATFVALPACWSIVKPFLPLSSSFFLLLLPPPGEPHARGGCVGAEAVEEDEAVNGAGWKKNGEKESKGGAHGVSHETEPVPCKAITHEGVERP